jgi:Raf kinase inhibitor-like YbhB/YbcL family protein
MAISVHSDGFSPGERIPLRYSQDGENVSPPLRWEGVPATAVELALIVDDPDAPRAQPFVHWVIYGIPSHEGGLPEGVPKGPGTGWAGAVQGTNDAGHQGWDGPAPPRGHGVHHYHFILYALSLGDPLPPGLDKPGLLRAIEGRILDSGEVVCTYER